MIRKFGLFVCILFLSGCSFLQDIQTKPVEKAQLALERPGPLELAPIEWQVKSSNGQAQYVLDQENYNNYELNQEALQNRLLLDETIIDGYQSYYEKAK